MRIDIYHDTVCPWCRIGKKNLKLALEQWGGEAEIYYHTYFLNPDIPPEGTDFKRYMSAKGGGQVPLENWFDAPRRMGEAVDLEFHFEKISRAPNSLLSHRLIMLTPGEKQEAMIDAIYDAYFRDGRDIGQLDVLIDIAAAQGLEAQSLRSRLLSDEAREQVEQEASEAQTMGITGVPFFILDQKYAFSGAHPPERIVSVLQQAS